MPKNARISINKLGEYCRANVTRRKQIVYDAKNPVPFKTTRYGGVRESINEYLLGGMDPAIIQEGISSISQKTAVSKFQISDKESSLEALSILAELDLSQLRRFTFEQADHEATLIKIKGVNISVHPDLILLQTVGDKEHIGALKIHIARGILGQESQKIISAVLYRYVEEKIARRNQITDLNMCLSLDVFGRHLEPSPASYKRRMEQVETACEEIALWWDTL